MKINLQKVHEGYQKGYADPFPDLKVKESGVVIPLYEIGEGHGVILTKRSEKLRSHPGQISFPGGVYSEEDKDFIDTALREWEEELGISKSNLEVIAPYKPVHTFTGYIIHPIVALYKGDFKFDHNSFEVEKVILLDLEEFNKSPFYTIANPRKPDFEGIYYLYLNPEILWGATCHILIHFLKDFTDFSRKPILTKSNLSYPPFLDFSNIG